ncbi:MAG TPA: hypothetical protein VNS32_17390, partial [Flavisolibacter sp.]|nr:hypothetical protein [Flavisolibacter sp.]
QPPMLLWKQYERDNFVWSSKADMGSAEEQPTRNSLMNGKVIVGGEAATAPSPPTITSLLLCIQKPLKNSLPVFKG